MLSLLNCLRPEIKSESAYSASSGSLCACVKLVGPVGLLADLVVLEVMLVVMPFEFRCVCGSRN